MSRFRSFFKPSLASLLTGILIGTSYVPFPPWALLFGYVPLWHDLLKTDDWKEAFKHGWWAQFTMTLIGFHWIAYVSKEFGYMPWPVAILSLLLFCAFMHLYIPFACALVVKLRRRLQLSGGASLILLASFFVLGEMYWPSMFRWNLGYPLLWIHSPFTQFADLIGFLGLSWSVHLINALLTWNLLQRSLKRFIWTAGSLALLLGLLHMIGAKRGEPWKEGDQTLKVLQIQANIGNLEKFMAEKGRGFRQFIVDQYFQQTREALKKYPQADLIIWPESAYPDYLDPHQLGSHYAHQFIEFVKSIGKPILTGAYSIDPPGPVKRNDYNSVFLFDQNAFLLGQPYHKTHLLIFGEYTPLGDLFPFLKQINPGGEGFGTGSGPMVIPFGNLIIGPQICYESLYPNFSQDLVRLGSDVLVNLTNDSWFGPSSEPYQHMIMTLARALEVRRPLIRNTNTGISTAVLADGTLLQESPTYQPWAGLFEIPIKKKAPLTFYTRFGAWLPFLILLVITLTALLGKKHARTPTP